MATRKPTPTICGVDIKPEKWTWEQAEEALSKNVSNRGIRRARVEAYGRAMEESLWGSAEAKAGYRASPGFIIFDILGNLIDGQHRLQAQVQAKTTQYWYVLRGVPTDTQNQIDVNINRTAADVLKLNGYDNYVILGSVARWAWLLEHGSANSAKVKVGNEEILDVIKRHPDLEHSALMGGRSRSGMLQQAIMPSPMGAAHWWIAQHNDHAEADLFVERFIHLHKEAPGSPIAALLNRLNSSRKADEYIHPRLQIAMIVKAWNLDVDRAYVKRMSTKSRAGEYLIPTVSKRVESQEDTFGPLKGSEVVDEEVDAGGIAEPKAAEEKAEAPAKKAPAKPAAKKAS